MPATRASARQASDAATGSSPTSKKSDSADPGSKRKGDPVASPKAKRGKKGDRKEQTTIEETMPQEDVEMKDKGAQENNATANDDADTKLQENDNAETKADPHEPVKDVGDAKGEQKEAVPENEQKGTAKTLGSFEDSSKEIAGGSKVSGGDNAVESSSKREESTPSSILEKGIIYFFERGRVGIDEPSSPDEIARSYIVLRPIPHGAKLGEGPIGDGGGNRLLALPKKVLPKSPKDRFMSFVEKANASLDDIKTNFGASDYATKTAGTRHTPPMAPLGEGIYAITSTGRESHLAYILTIPSEVSEVQKDIGLQQRGSFITSIKNPSYSGPANASLPKGPDFPQELLDEFRGLRWMPLQPRFLDYANAQILLIGHQDNALGKAADKEVGGQDQGKDKPIEEMEKLEDEDQIRIEHLRGDDSVFVDLGLSSQEYPKVQTTW